MLKAGVFIGDRYEIIDRVGSGGMADVYKAKCHRLNRFVAIKILKSEYSNDKNFVNKFRVEAQSVAGLSHPNIVNVYDVGEDNGTYYIVMELVEGITLKKYIERKSKLEVKESVGIAMQIASGIEAAHNNHIIHRDIKPQNIIISREGKVKVTDFGIAKAATSNTINSNAMGSVHYISPEQARGGYSDEKSDIYSLGITIYEMLTGKVPFEGDNTISVALLHIQVDMLPPRQLEPRIPISLEQIVMKCTQKRAERRYLSVGELIADLRRSLSEPDDDFVKIKEPEVDTSPTIVLSDADVYNIKNSTRKSIENGNLTEESNKTEENHINYTPIRSKPDIKESIKLKDTKEDELEGDIDPKLEKILVAGGVVVAVLLAFIVIFLIGKALGVFSFPGGNGNKENTTTTESTQNSTNATSDTDDITVPDLYNLTYEEAVDKLNDLGLGIIQVEEFDDFVEKGHIFEQNPAKDDKVEMYTTINVKISKGPELFSIPDVVNRSASDADIALREEGFNPLSEYENSDIIEEGNVIRTEPANGESAKKGETIRVYISLGKSIVEVIVPDLRDLTEAEAGDKLKEFGLVKGEVRYATSDKVKEGLVIIQNYTVGTKVSEGTIVDLTISLGTPITEPTTEATTKKEIITYEGSVIIIDNPFDEFNTEGEVSFELTKDGETIEIVREYWYDSDNPFPFLLESKHEAKSEGKGIIKMYLNGELCQGYWSIDFKKVVN